MTEIIQAVNYTIDCWAFFGKVDWAKENVYDYIAAVDRIYALFETKATRYGFCENPYGTIKGTHGGSAKNVLKKVDDIYSKETKLKMLEFFSLPKDFNFQYGEYGIYISRSEDFMVIGYDMELYPEAPIEAVLLEMKNQMAPIWGEHFQITKGNQPYVYCMDKLETNPNGEKLIKDAYIEKWQPIHIIEQFRV